MKIARSGIRAVALLACIASASTGLAVFVGCGSDAGNENGASSGDPGGGDPSKNDGAASGGDGGVLADGAIACSDPNALGKACEPDAAPCPCGLSCSGARCTTPAACNEALLSWTGPTQNTDGTCLRDLAGFVIYSALDASGGPYPNVVDAGLPCVQTGMGACGDAEAVPQLQCSYRLKPLANGTWYFVVTSYSDAGVESVPTGEVSKNIACP